MTKSNTASDRQEFNNYFYDPYLKQLTQIGKDDKVDKRWTAHHRVNQQWARHNPEKYDRIKEKEQGIYFLPTFVHGFDNMHADADNRNRNFKEKWGFDLEVFLFDVRKI